MVTIILRPYVTKDKVNIKHVDGVVVSTLGAVGPMVCHSHID